MAEVLERTCLFNALFFWCETHLRVVLTKTCQAGCCCCLHSKTRVLHSQDVGETCWCWRFPILHKTGRLHIAQHSRKYLSNLQNLESSFLLPCVTWISC